jgi:polyvinyl alcohol dehydrogenase (cytochrome)
MLLTPIVAGTAWWLLSDSPMKSLESFAIRNVEHLPLAYLGNKVFDRHCANCHDNPAMHAPTREALAGFSKEAILVAMEFGKMQPMSAHLSKQQRNLVAHYLAGSGADQYGWLEGNRCSEPATGERTDFVANWGLGSHNRRFVPEELTSINRDNVDTLELAWALAFPKVTDMRSQPAIIGDTLYFGDKTGKLYAVDRHSGCIRNHAEVISGIRSAITVVDTPDGKRLLVFADSLGSIYAFDHQTLDKVWQHDGRLFETSIITGSISHHQGRLFVPVSSYEAAAAGSAAHECCHAHGGVIALEAANGDRLWEWHATEPATLQKQLANGKALYGPAGATVWSTPTIDARRGRIYIGTGQNLSHPTTDTSDAVIALDMDSGELQWRFQATQGDAWNAACLNGGPNCPENAAGDFDFGASIILAELSDGREILLAGQKSGEVYALNPDPATADGEVIWHTQVSNAAVGPNLAQTTTNGGVHWGMSVAGQRLFVAAADPERDRPGYTPKPGLHALNLADGNILWHYLAERGCELDEANRLGIGLENMRSDQKRDQEKQYECSFYYGLSAATTATPDLVFSGGLDGKLRAFDARSGEILWQTNTAVPFTTVNGVAGRGGSIDVDGQTIAGGYLYVQSGYSMFAQLPGNVLLAYKIAAPQAPE